MLKNFVKRKFVVTTFAFIIFFITLFFPSQKEKTPSFNTSYVSGKTNFIYLLNNDDYVSRTIIATKETEKLKIIEELISFLTIDSKSESYIPNFFSPVIPCGTKILSLDIQDKLLKINFSEEFLNIPPKYAEKMLECLVYTLTEIDGIEGIMITVNGNLLESLPSSSKKLPHILTRDIGVNTIYNLKNVKDVTKTTTYYLAKNNDTIYYVPVTLLENNDKHKIEIIIERLKSNPHLKTNLMSYLNASAQLNSYELLEEEIRLSFNDALYEGLTKDEMKEYVEYSLALSIKDTFNVKKVTIS